MLDDGFIFVEKKQPVKTKPRPKDPNEARDYHRKQHGYREKKSEAT